MNADSDPNFTDQDRYNLVASEHQVNGILSQCRYPNMKVQILLPGDPNIPVNEFQKDFIQESSCMVCKEIPLRAKECYNCNKLICFLCDLKLTYKNGMRVQNKCCYNCQVMEQKQVVSMPEDMEQPTVKDPKKGPGDMIDRPIF